MQTMTAIEDQLRQQLKTERDNNTRLYEKLNAEIAERVRWKDRALYAESMLNRLAPFLDEWKDSQRPRNGARRSEGE